MDQVVRVALNNYRATGKFPTAPKLYQSTVEVRELITNWIQERGTISPEDVFVQNFELLPPVRTWHQDTTAEPVSRGDNAKLLWTAFGQSPDQFMKLPREKKEAGATLTREGALYLLVNRAIAPLVDASKAVLAPYTDHDSISSWAKNATAYAIESGIFVPAADQILPKQLATNAEVLAWVRAALYPAD